MPYSGEQAVSLYSKYAGMRLEPPLFHIHIDAQQVIPDEAVQELLATGFRRSDSQRPQDITHQPLNTAAPINHMTLQTSDKEVLKRAMKAADTILLHHKVHSCTELEYIALDKPLETRREFDQAAFDRFAPNATHADIAAGKNTFDSPVVDDKGKTTGWTEKRLLPIKAIKRRLDPIGAAQAGKTMKEAGAKEHFRNSEAHIAIRKDGLDPRTAALLQAIGYTQPEIPKAVIGNDDEIMRRPDGNPKIFVEMPMTIQVAQTPGDLIAVTDIVVKKVLQEIGGVGAEASPGIETASIKYKPATGFGLYNGRKADGSILHFDPALDEPMIADHFVDVNRQRLTQERLSEMGGNRNSIGGFSVAARSGEVQGEKIEQIFSEIERAQGWPKQYDLKAVIADRKHRLAHTEARRGSYDSPGQAR